MPSSQTLRNKETKRAEFRSAAQKPAFLIAAKAAQEAKLGVFVGGHRDEKKQQSPSYTTNTSRLL